MFKYKEELEYLDRDGVWYPVSVLDDDGSAKVKVESDLTGWEYWADREKLRRVSWLNKFFDAVNKFSKRLLLRLTK